MPATMFRPLAEALLRAILRREPDAASLDYVVTMLESGVTSGQVVSTLRATGEYDAKTLLKLDPVVDAEAVMQGNRFRIEMTVGCRDCDAIPKVAHAGEVVVRDGERIQIMHNGLEVIEGGYYGDWTTEIVRRLRGHHEPQEELVFDALLRCLPERACMIELGGFWSYYSLWFLQGGAGRRAMVLEPDPNYLAVGRKNAALNGATIAFRQGFVGPSDIAATPFQTESAGLIDIPMVRASGLVRDWGPNGLDLLHCDAQGAETAVIADCEPLLRSGHIRFLVVSTHAESISGDALTHQRCLAMVRDFGGRVLAEHDVHESFSGDGLIAAYFGREALDWPELRMSRNRYSTSLFRNPLFDLRSARLVNESLRERLAAREDAPGGG